VPRGRRRSGGEQTAAQRIQAASRIRANPGVPLAWGDPERSSTSGSMVRVVRCHALLPGGPSLLRDSEPEG
jgi:hypothetical protein